MERVISQSSGGLSLDEAIEALEKIRDAEDSEGLISIKLHSDGGDGTQIVLDGRNVYVRPKW